MSARVVISRGTRGEAVNGKPRPDRVYITGPHFGTSPEGGIFSSTETKDEASVYTRAEAERMLARGKWRHNLPEIEPAP